MRTILLIASCCMLIASGVMAFRQIRAKKPITDLYLLFSLITFFTALQLVGMFLGD